MGEVASAVHEHLVDGYVGRVIWLTARLTEALSSNTRECLGGRQPQDA